MTKQPWEEKVVEDKDQTANRKTKGSVVSTPLLTGLLSVFFVIIVAILFVVFYTSNRSGDKVSETSNFYGASTSSSVSTSSSTETSETTSEETPSESDSTSEAPAESTEETPATSQSTDTTLSSSSTDTSSNGGTITVLPGEGAASIAARAGISVDTLYQLNPSHMTSGYWYANPGDVVNVN
ncbi:SAG1386/EF1546 family surface-associated protein [Streptococcus alactolyticus]|uniref:SAG1386/EF1546 family surface-associated protein n=1 Tax=Streptococcus alactolyticus TaxID=29389 RepID=UPI003F9E4F31